MNARSSSCPSVPEWSVSSTVKRSRINAENSAAGIAVVLGVRPCEVRIKGGRCKGEEITQKSAQAAGSARW